MKLEDGKSYTSRDGSRVAKIMGDARTSRPGTVWSLQGDWYDRETGAFLFYDGRTGEHVPKSPNWRDLVAEAVE